MRVTLPPHSRRGRVGDHLGRGARGEPELAAARAAGIPVVKRAAALGWLLEGLRTIAVAGTHGKTTTSVDAGGDPAPCRP